MELNNLIFFTIFAGIFLAGRVDSTFIAYNTSAGIVPGKINVHLVPHSHDDVGWLKTATNVHGKYYLRIDPRGEGAKWRRTFGQEVYSPLLLAFSEEEGNTWMSSHVTTFSAIDQSYTLPNNIAELQSGGVLLRLAHLYETEEDKDYSVMTDVELKKLFPGKKITKVTEMSLSANQERKKMEKARLKWKAIQTKPEWLEEDQLIQ